MTLRRVAIVFNGSLPTDDGVAAFDRSFTRDLQQQLLDREHFDAFYRLDDECTTQDVRSEVVCRTPTLDNLSWVVRDITARFGADEVSVFTFVRGHSWTDHGIPTPTGRIAGRKFAEVLNQFPTRVARVTDFHLCFAGGFVAFGLVDDNDLLRGYSGSDEVSWGDASGITIFHDELDPDGDGHLRLREAHWLGQSYIYTKFTPRRRRSIFWAGRNFVDRGFGTETLPPPFPVTVVTVPDVSTYVRLTQRGAMQGVTVIGFEGESMGTALKRRLERAAAKNGGTTQFLWVPAQVAKQVARPKDVRRLSQESIFKIFYHGSDETRSFTLGDDVQELLDKIYRGQRF